MDVMRITPGLFGSLFTGSRGWDLCFDEQRVRFTKDGKHAITMPFEAITAVTSKPGTIWAEVRIESAAQRISCDGIVNDEATRFTEALRPKVGHALLLAATRHESAINEMAASVTGLLLQPKYLAHHDIEVWKSTIVSNRQSTFAEGLALVSNPLLPRTRSADKLRQNIDLLSDVLYGPRAHVKARNEKFVAQEIGRNKPYFDTVEKTPLTHEQRVASVVMEDRNLLVAAAGSGKTSTVVGKIGYALRTEHFAPNDFLVLAFNNAAAKELDERINERLRELLPPDQRIKAKTFHALGLEIIATAEGVKPMIANFAGGGEAADSVFMEQLIQDLLSKDDEFATDWVMFRAVCFKGAKDPAEFKTVEDWNQYVQANGEYQNGRRGFLTMNGEIVKSQGELAIANWLYINGVEYEYERPYEYETADREYRQYRPDFYLPVIKTYLEHYALDKNGNTPALFGERYSESLRWKEQLHAENGTSLMTTTFADFVSGELFPKLKTELQKRGQRFSPRPLADVLARLNGLQRTDYGPFLRTFLKHAKSNEMDLGTLRSRVANNPQPYRAELFVRVAWTLLTAYKAKLRSSGEIDFEDMIIRATHHVAANRYQHQYRLILVDEFQDISQARAKLLKALLSQAPGCKLFAVGDDWQSIYRFAGADIGVFTDFPGHFGMTATSYLTQTFRSNQGITDVASRFVQKNPSQMKKRVSARDKTTQAVVVIRTYDRFEDIDEECEECLIEIASKKAAEGRRTTVFIVGRYRFREPDSLDTWKARFRRSVDITFKTIHSSKGLEADYVIVLGMHTGRYAFPSEINDDPLLQLVMPQAESFPNVEERRLFYVALTRARHGVYLLGSSYSPSGFLTELLEDESLRLIVRDEQEKVTRGDLSSLSTWKAQNKNRQVRGIPRLLHLPDLQIQERCC